MKYPFARGIVLCAFSVVASCQGGQSEAPTDAAPTPDGDPLPDAPPEPPPAVVTAASVPVTSTITTLAGSIDVPGGPKDGIGSEARFASLRDIAIDSQGALYVADLGNGRVRKVTAGGEVSTVTGAYASPWGVAVAANGDIFVGAHYKIYKVAGTDVSTLAGSDVQGYSNATGTDALFGEPSGLGIDAAGSIFVADASNDRLRKVTSAGAVTFVANGSGPRNVAVDPAGNLYFVDTRVNRIRKFTQPAFLSNVAGADDAGFVDGAARVARFNQPDGIALDSKGNVYVADTGNNRVRRVTLAGLGLVTTLAMDVKSPQGVAVDPSGNVYYGDGAAIRKLIPVGIGDLKISWPLEAGAIGYVAVAQAAGKESKTCNTSAASTCTLHGLISGVLYEVTVTATTATGTTTLGSATARPN